MFWDKGYAPSASSILALLEKENATLEEFLDEEDILQECKTQKKNLVNYFTRPEVIRRLVELITTEPSEDVPMVQRYRYANMSCEILTLGLPSLDEKLLSDTDTLQLLYSYLEKEPPLNPLLSSFFSKTFSKLFTKKPEQDWFSYQHMCLQLLEYIKSQNDFLDLICKHFDTPVIPDLIMQMMKDIEGGQLKRNLYEWLTEDKIVERLIAILRNPQETDKHANVAEFFCDLINQGRSMRQTEQENDSFEPAFDGSNPILKTIESAETIEALLNVILEPNALESAILSGISVVLTLIKPLTFTDEPNSDRQRLLQKREREFHQEVQETVITVMAPRLTEFVHVLKNPPVKPTLETTAAVLNPPFGKTRLQVCRVFTALLETKHETIQQAICTTEYFSLLLEYFKQYCWNNFLHSELEKALSLVFYNELSNNSSLTECTEMSYGKQMTNDDIIFNCFMKAVNTSSGDSEVEMKNALNDVKRAQGGGNLEGQTSNDLDIEIEAAAVEENLSNNETKLKDVHENATEARAEGEPVDEEKGEKDNKQEELGKQTTDAETPAENYVENNVEGSGTEQELNDLDKTKSSNSAPPTEIQTHLIVDCHLIPKLLDYWQYNTTQQSAEKGRRLGYMGHLIKILRHITNCISESEHIGALITSNLSDDTELPFWQTLTDAETGEFTLAVKQQTKLLANCNPHEDNEYNTQGSKDFLAEASAWDIGDLTYSNMSYNDLDGTLQDIVFTMDNDQNLFQFGRNIDDDDDDDDDQNGVAGSGAGDGHGMFTKNSVTLSNLAAADPWDMDVHFADTGTSNWADFNSDNFADFDVHFSSFGSDLNMPHTQPPNDESATPALSSNAKHQQQSNEPLAAHEAEEDVQMSAVKEPKSQDDGGHNSQDENDQQAEYDNNANVEKSSTMSTNEKLATEPNEVQIALGPASIVTRLQSVLLDGEEDYEDDEGMWTKPLGGDRQTTEGPTQTPAPLANGPSTKQLAELNNASQINDNSEEGDSSTVNITADQQKLPTDTSPVKAAAPAGGIANVETETTPT